MKILAIDTSCDETAAAVTQGRRVLSNVTYSQILIHQKWGGVVPNLARRAHEERIDGVIAKALGQNFLPRNRNFSRSELAARKSGFALGQAQTSTSDKNFITSANSSKELDKGEFEEKMEQIDCIAVTYGPGLAIALGVGIEKAKQLAKKYKKKLIAVNHMEGHIYSCFAQNSAGNPERPFEFPYLCLLVSGGHTELVLFKAHLDYQVIGETVDDAAGESLDKAARLIMANSVYPGGPVIEQLAKSGNPTFIKFPRPMQSSGDFNFSYSGLKTSLYNYLQKNDDNHRLKHLNDIAASFQEAVIDSLFIKLEQAMEHYGVKNVLIAGGVVANSRLRLKIRQLVKKKGGTVLFPTSKNLYGDNAAMIGVAANYKAKLGYFVKDIEELDRDSRARLG